MKCTTVFHIKSNSNLCKTNYVIYVHVNVFPLLDFGSSNIGPTDDSLYGKCERYNDGSQIVRRKMEQKKFSCDKNYMQKLVNMKLTASLIQ